MHELWMVLNKYINPIEEPKQWLPIMVLVYLVLAKNNLKPFLKKLKHQECHQIEPTELYQLLLFQYVQRFFLYALAAILSWALLFEIIF